MPPLCVVKVQPCRQRHVAFLRTGIGPSVSPLAQAGLDEPLGFAVSTGSVRPGSQMAQALACTGLPEHVAAIAVPLSVITRSTATPLQANQASARSRKPEALSLRSSGRTSL